MCWNGNDLSVLSIPCGLRVHGPACLLCSQRSTGSRIHPNIKACHEVCELTCYVNAYGVDHSNE